jgi:hypothetical protein
MSAATIWAGPPEADWQERIDAHRAGRGAAITRAAVAAGIELELVRTWPGENRVTERRFKRAGHFADRCCPRCGPPVSREPLGDLAARLARRQATAFAPGLDRGW